MVSLAGHSLRAASPGNAAGKKARLWSKHTSTGFISSTGQPAALRLTAQNPKTPAEAAAAVQAAVAAQAAALGYSVEEEVAKLKAALPAVAKADAFADVDPAVQPLTWQLLQRVNNTSQSEGQDGQRSVVSLLHEVCSMLGSPPDYKCTKQELQSPQQQQQQQQQQQGRVSAAARGRTAGKSAAAASMRYSSRPGSSSSSSGRGSGMMRSTALPAYGGFNKGVGLTPAVFGGRMGVGVATAGVPPPPPPRTPVPPPPPPPGPPT
jgi:hypothetical protein